MNEERAFQLHMAEYNALRAEILSQQAVRQRTLQLGVGAIIAIWAFLLSETLKPDLLVMEIAAWWLPVPVAAAGLVMNFSASMGVKQAGAYLAMIEEKYADVELKGWENTLIYMRNADSNTDDSDNNWPSRPAPTDPMLARLNREIKAREIRAGHSTVIRSLWKIILAATTAVALAASYLVYVNSIT